ncbi:uncharacterized protein [Haliotis asinina]|uniref:uncharacterized protein n=1 Tax=Haliotis asinina TaxID=109174 RepID=UPI0035318E2E
MSVSLTREKADKIQKACIQVMRQPSVSVRQLAEVIGYLVASLPGVKLGPLFYRRLDNHKSRVIKQTRGDYDQCITLTEEDNRDLTWWIRNIHTAGKPISVDPPSVTLSADASKKGWGGVRDGQSTGGHWSHDEADKHINYLELLAAFLTLRAFCVSETNCHIRLLLDNSTAVAYINHMGGKKSLLNSLVRQMWEWCISRDIWISAAHLPGKFNVLADKASRLIRDNTEWYLTANMFDGVCYHFGTPEIDLFASRLNNRLPKYVSWKPDPDALAVDAFSIPCWKQYFYYAFPPFSVINAVLKKTEEYQARGILIAPLWSTQSWFPRLLRLITQTPLILPPARRILRLPHNDGQTHPLTKMTLAAFLLSGDLSEGEEFRRGLPKSSFSPGELTQESSMPPMSTGGWCYAVKDRLIRCVRM